MSTDYPRTIAVHRPATLSGVGIEINYVAQIASEEMVIATGITASIQARPFYGPSKQMALPSDIYTPIIWDVLIPEGEITDGLVKNCDIIIDEFGNRFQVAAVYTNSFGLNFIVEQMEA